MVDPSDLSGAIKGRENINEQIISLIGDAKDNIILITTADGLVRKAAALRKNAKKLAEKKVKVRIVAPITKENALIVKELSKFAEIRNTQRIDSRFLIVDNKKVLFMLMGDKEVHSAYDAGVWVETPYFANALGNFFNVVWEKLEDSKKIIQGFETKK